MIEMENKLALKATTKVPKAAMPQERSHKPWRVLADPNRPLNIAKLEAAYKQVFGTQEDSGDATAIEGNFKRKLSDDQRAMDQTDKKSRTTTKGGDVRGEVGEKRPGGEEALGSGDACGCQPGGGA